MPNIRTVTQTERFYEWGRPQRVRVLQVGQVMRVMKFAERWAASADPSLVRHFILNLLAACAPPYSSDFAASLVRQDPTFASFTINGGPH